MYRAARVVAAFLLTCLSPVTYHHLERAQLDAPYILISNHNSLMDPLLVAWKCYRYQIRFLGKKELVKNPLLRWLFQKLLMIDVDRHNMDMAALRACLKTLREGHPLGVFPEGTRHKEGVMEHMESGIAMIALRSGARLLPAYIAAGRGCSGARMSIMGSRLASRILQRAVSTGRRAGRFWSAFRKFIWHSNRKMRP